MTEWITKQQAMDHLRLDEVHVEGTNDLDAMIEGAKQITSDFLNRPIPWKNCDGREEPVPGSVVSAALLILGSLYDEREGGKQALSASAKCLLWPYRRTAL